MDEKLQERLADALDKVTEYVTDAEGFVVEQAPLVVEELLAYGWYSSLLLVMASVVAIVLLSSGWLLTKTATFKRLAGADRDIFLMPIAIVQLCALFPLITLVSGLSTMLKIQVAPRLYVLETLSEML